MTIATAPTFLRDLANGTVVPGELVYGIGVSHIKDWHNAWQPALGAIKAALHEQGVPKADWPQTGHWNWAAKVAEDDLLGFRTFSVTAEGMTQALMRIDLTSISIIWRWRRGINHLSGRPKNIGVPAPS